MSDRITGLVVAVLALGFFAAATQLEQPFFPDPLGPKAFPMLIASGGFLAGVYLVVRPDAEPNWPGIATFLRLLIATVVLVLYAFSLGPLGFLLPTAAAAAAISYQITPSVKVSAVTGVAMSIGLFVVFKYALGLGLFAFPRWLTG